MYPVPAVVIGAMNGNKPTWTLAAHLGIIGHDRILVSLVGAHFITKLISQDKKLSINLVNEEILPQADYAGAVSGTKTDKSDLFEYELGSEGTPIIKKSPLTIECRVVDVYPTEGFENFICKIDNTYVEEDCLNEEGKIDYNILKPVLFEFPTYQYLRTGEVIGKCLSFKSSKKI